METLTKKLYEAMFLIDSAQAGSDWDGTMAAVNRVLERADAEVVYLEKWADRRLAFEIDHKTRGTYILCYFRADGARIAGIEKDVTLSEKIMRVLILSAEDRPGDSVKRDLAGETKAPQEAYSRSDDHSGSRKANHPAKDRKDGKAETSPKPAEAEVRDTGAASEVKAPADTGAETETPLAQAAETSTEEAAAADDEAAPDAASERE